MKENPRMLLALAPLAILLLVPRSASAYAGPGSGLTVIGAALAFVGAVLFAIVGFVWYPIKRLWRAVSARRQSRGGSSADVVSR
jgi:hypothetical protein